MILSNKSLTLIILGIVICILSLVTAINDFTFGCSDEDLNITFSICKYAKCDEVVCEKGELVPGGGWCGCCNICLKNLEEFEPCEFHQAPLAPIKRKCRPGLICDLNYKVCRRISKDSDCFQMQVFYDSINETEKLKNYRPECDENGLYKSKQCRGTMCYCVSRVGREIDFRRVIRTSSHEMTCDCVRAHFEGQKHLRCLPNGNYDTLQCKGSFCYCIDEHQQQTGNAVYKRLISTLSCHETSTFKEHLSLCQQQEKEIEDRIEAAKAKGTKLIGDDRPQCLPDGTFKAKQCRGTDCFCVTRSGKFIPNYRQLKIQAIIDEMTCICASENNDISDGLAVSIGYACHYTSGNFQRKQCLGTECFCVEVIYGYRFGEPVSNDELENLKCE